MWSSDVVVEENPKIEVLAHDIYRIVKDKNIPDGYALLENDDHLHWSVWKTEGFLELCRHMELNVIEFQDVDDKVGNGFTVVIQK